MFTPSSRFLSLAALAAVLYGAPADAQTGRVTGVVRDTRGVALSGVAVRAVSQEAGPTRRTTTLTDGSYTIGNLPAGTYTVSAAMPGLRTVSQRDEP